MNALAKRLMSLPIPEFIAFEPKHSANRVRLVPVDPAKEQELEGLPALLLGSLRRTPAKTKVHEMITQELRRDAFSLKGKVRFVTCHLIERAVNEGRPDYWERIELLLGTPGARFVDDALRCNVQPVLECISDYLSSTDEHTVKYSLLWEQIVSFVLVRVHEAYTQAKHEFDTCGHIDHEAEDQVQRGGYCLRLLLERLRLTRGNTGVTERLKSCMARIEPVLSYRYRA